MSAEIWNNVELCGNTCLQNNGSDFSYTGEELCNIDSSGSWSLSYNNDYNN
jgi:hypothetical protein